MTLSRVWSAIDRYSERVISAANIIAVMTAFLVSFLIAFDVAKRYLFNSPLPGTYEIVHKLLVLIVFFGLAYTQKTRSHIRIEIIDIYLSRHQQLVLEIIVFGISLIYFVIHTWVTGDVALASLLQGEHSGGEVSIPVYPAKLILAAGSALISLQFLIDIVNDIKEIRKTTGDNNS